MFNQLNLSCASDIFRKTRQYGDHGSRCTVTADPAKLTTRKRRHIDVCLEEQVSYVGLSTGLDRYRLPYDALTQTSMADVDLSTTFFGARLRAPVLIGAMTGGAELSGQINRNLAAAAQQLG